MIETMIFFVSVLLGMARFGVKPNNQFTTLFATFSHIWVGLLLALLFWPKQPKSYRIYIASTIGVLIIIEIVAHIVI